MKLAIKFYKFFRINEMPVPQDEYLPSVEFAEKLRASQSQGSVSLGDGRFFTKDKKDELYDSIKDYNFT